MASPDNDKLAREVMQAHASFEERLHGKGRFPHKLFQAFFDAAVRYVTATADEPMIHRNVAGVVTSLREILELKSLRAPGKASLEVSACGRDDQRLTRGTRHLGPPCDVESPRLRANL